MLGDYKPNYYELAGLLPNHLVWTVGAHNSGLLLCAGLLEGSAGGSSALTR